MIDKEEKLNVGNYFLHSKSGNVYKIVECRDNLIKLNGKWSPGVIYTRGDIQSELYVRTIDDFKNNFEHIYSPVNNDNPIMI